MTATTLTRDTITSDRQMDVQIRAKDDAGRSFTGLGVPYGETIDLWGMRERFDAGSVELDGDGVPSLVLWRHDEPIGRITAGRDTDAGFEIDGQLSDTPRGREAATLLADGVITRLSIGFRPEQYRIEIDETEGIETVVHEKVRALEFSLVPFPAYSSATVTKVRHRTDPAPQEDSTMTETTLTRADLDPIETGLQDLERKLANIDENVLRAAGPAQPHFRSMGEYLKAVARGDEYAVEFHRATSGQVSSDTIKNESYIGEFVKFVQDRRRLINTFDKGPLPADGMSVEYAQLKSNTLKAGEQATEGTNLPGPGKVILESKSEPIRTFGGWTELSRQIVERSSIAYLDIVLKALGLEYIKATNAAFRERILEVITSQAASAIELPTAATIYDWRDAIIDAADLYETNGFALEGLLVSKDKFKELQRLEYTNVPALKVNAADEFSGTLTLPQGDGNLASVNVQTMFGEVPEGTAAFYDSSALQTRENPNAPTQLQDENIVNLTKQFSLYGYMAVTAPFPTAIVPVTTAAAAG
ncbi:HK97 family phage prohead protease [Brachybacterium tyrofermentans]|uniref:HK97 family phage prohead protease n=1 Tax=Brachybacterium tyrofermentans TaxID=47848 RepID=UPI003FD1B11F